MVCVKYFIFLFITKMFLINMIKVFAAQLYKIEKQANFNYKLNNISNLDFLIIFTSIL